MWAALVSSLSCLLSHLFRARRHLTSLSPWLYSRCVCMPPPPPPPPPPFPVPLPSFLPACLPPFISLPSLRVPREAAIAANYRIGPRAVSTCGKTAGGDASHGGGAAEYEGLPCLVLRCVVKQCRGRGSVCHRQHLRPGAGRQAGGQIQACTHANFVCEMQRCGRISTSTCQNWNKKMKQDEPNDT